MSRVSEAREAWHKAKWAALVGLGYLAARKPLLAGKVGAMLAYMVVRQNLRDAYTATRLIWKELARPVLAEDAAIATATARATWAGMLAQGAAGATAGASLLFFGMGGAIVQSMTTGSEYLEELLGWDDPLLVDGMRVD